MRWIMSAMAAAILIGAASVGLGAAERAVAEVSCQPTDQRLVYDCMIMLTGKNSGRPLENATIVIKVDMPSMPMAHNAPPVTAEAIGAPGGYRATLELAMPGEWALTMDVAGPTRDRIIKKVQFGGKAMDRGKPKMRMKTE